MGASFEASPDLDQLQVHRGDDSGPWRNSTGRLDEREDVPFNVGLLRKVIGHPEVVPVRRNDDRREARGSQ